MLPTLDQVPKELEPKEPVFMSAKAWPEAAEKNHKNWSDYGGGPDSSHFVALHQITKSNVNQLQVAWVYPTGDNHAYMFNPIVVDNVCPCWPGTVHWSRWTQALLSRSS